MSKKPKSKIKEKLDHDFKIGDLVYINDKGSAPFGNCYGVVVSVIEPHSIGIKALVMPHATEPLWDKMTWWYAPYNLRFIRRNMIPTLKVWDKNDGLSLEYKA